MFPQGHNIVTRLGKGLSQKVNALSSQFILSKAPGEGDWGMQNLMMMDYIFEFIQQRSPYDRKRLRNGKV